MRALDTLVFSVGIHVSESVVRDERESEDKNDNRGEGKVKASVRLSNRRKSSCSFSFFGVGVLHSIRD